MFVLALCFGSVFMFSAIALKGFHPIAVGSLRMITASLFLLCIVRLFGYSLVTSRSHWKFVFIFGAMFSALPFLALPWALQFVSTTAAAIAFASIPLMVLVLSRIFFKSPITLFKWIGFLIGSSGLVLLASVGSNTMDNGANLSRALPIIPYCVVLASAFGFAAGGVYLQTAPKIPMLSLITSAFLAGNVVAVPALLITFPKVWPPIESIVSILMVGIICTGLGTVIRGTLIQREGIIFTSINGYISPIFASILGFSLLGETLTMIHGFAYLMVVVGLLISRNK